MPNQPATSPNASGSIDWTPGLLGLGGGALLGALATPTAENESPRARAIRTLRNAAAAGILGGAGTQLLANAGQQAVEGLTGPANKPDQAGVLRSLPARLGYMAMLNRAGTFRRDVQLSKSLRGLFQSAKNVGGFNFNPAAGVDERAHWDTVRSQLRSAAESENWDKIKKQLSRTGKSNPENIERFLDLNFSRKLPHVISRNISPRASTEPLGGMRTARRSLGVAAQLAAGLAVPDLFEKAKDWSAGKAEGTLGDMMTGYMFAEPDKPLPLPLRGFSLF